MRFLGELLLATFSAAVLLPFVFVVWPQIRWGASKYLRLASDGVEMGQWLRTRSCRWEDIRSVTDLHPSGVVVTTAAGRTLRMTTDTFTPNTVTLADLVRFYWRHPEAHRELTDGVAKRRFDERLGLLSH